MQVGQLWTDKRAKNVEHADLGVEGQEQAMQQALRCVHVGGGLVPPYRYRSPGAPMNFLAKFYRIGGAET